DSTASACSPTTVDPSPRSRRPSRSRPQADLGRPQRWTPGTADAGHQHRAMPDPKEGRVSIEALRDKIKALMPRARRDLAQMVAFRSVNDAAQFPPAECAGMVD